MSLYDAVRDLPAAVDGYALEGLEQQVSSGFLRKTTVIRSRAPARRGSARTSPTRRPSTISSQAAGPVLPLAGDWTLDDVLRASRDARRSSTTSPSSTPTSTTAAGPYESAALDLALRQAGLSLGDAVGRTARPLTFVVSMRLGEPATTERLRAWLEYYPTLRFKLDATADWTDELIAELAATGAVDSVDFKGQYRGTKVDTVPDPELYERVVAGLPDAWLEDPALTPETEAVLEPHHDRVTWDAAIHSVARHPGAALAAADGQREALAVRLGRAALRRVRLLRGATTSAPTAAASSSSASAATRSSSSHRCSTRTRRTTSRPAASTSTRSRACREPARGRPARDRVRDCG